jgi:hypothetical protein
VAVQLGQLQNRCGAFVSLASAVAARAVSNSS